MKKIIAFILTTATMLSLVTGAYAVPIFERQGRVLVLTYHKISEKPAEWSDFCISPTLFEEDLKKLTNMGYTFLTTTQLAKEPKQKGKKIAVITFDDGYESDYKYALPLLIKYNACATFFVFGAALNTKEYMSEQQLASLAKSPYAEIGNHSYGLHYRLYSTLSLMYADKKYNDEIIDDYKRNCELIKKVTGIQPVAISYPNGVYSKEIDSALKKSGYKISFSTEEKPYIGELTLPIGRKNRGYLRDMNNILR